MSDDATNGARDVESSSDLVVEHINSLSEIKKDVPELLRAAGNAINALSNRPLPSDSGADPLQARKDAYSEHTARYFQLIKTIGERLNDEAQALSDAGVIPEKEKKGVSEQGGDVKNGGLGELDIGWLNARTKDPGVEKAGELLAEARERVQRRQRELRESGQSMEE